MACIFSIRRLADLFLRGIKLDLQQGLSCPTRRCKFIDYEDLPSYSAASETGTTVSSEVDSTLGRQDMPMDKLPVYSMAECKKRVK